MGRHRFVPGIVVLVVVATLGGSGYFTPATVAAGADPIRYTYDANGRLSGIVDPTAGSAAYTYDAAGNRTAITRRTITTVAVLEVTPDGGPAGGVQTQVLFARQEPGI